MRAPKVSVVMPARQEERHIGAAILSLVGQARACDGELIVAEGGSTDRTRQSLEDLAHDFPAVRVIDNPGGHPATGLNRAISSARGDVIVRVDAHTVYSSDYLEECVRLVLEGAGDIVGGCLNPKGRSPFGRAVAHAMTTPWAIGPAKFHSAREPGPVDTVYLGAFRKSVALRLGGYRAFPSRAAEDADFCARARRAGLTVWLAPSIGSDYSVRETPVALFHQSWRYGRAKAEILLATGSLPSWRPVAPAGLAGVIAHAVLFPRRRWPRRLLCVWLAVLAWSGRRAGATVQRALFVGAAGVMQSAYGFGFWFGLLRGPKAGRPLIGPAAGWAASGSIRHGVDRQT